MTGEAFGLPARFVHGIGIDVCEIARVRRIVDRYGDRFLRRVFTDGERAYAQAHRDPIPSLAARFAAKEAALKALGAGMPPGMTWRDFEVVRHGGPPRLKFNGLAGEIAVAEKVGAAHLALSHDGGMATAFVVLERQDVTPIS
jgi:holo-[acyl-carrier protein] synthase